MGMLISDYRTVNPLLTGNPEGMASAIDVDFVPGHPVEVVRMGVITDSDDFLHTANALFECQFDLHSKTSSGAGYTITTATETVQTATAADLAFAGNGIYVDTVISMRAGEKIHCRISAGGQSSAGALGSIFIEFRDLPWQGHGAPTSAPGDGAGAGDIENMTKV